MRGRARPDLARLAPLLLELRGAWRDRALDSDPLLFPHRYAAPADREVAAFVAATLAFGRVASVKASVGKVLDALGPSPAEALRDAARPPAALSRFVHRWVSAADLAAFLRAVGSALRYRGSLAALLLAHDRGGPDYVEALDGFYAELRERTAVSPRAVSRGLRFLLPAPAEGGACKRAHLFLRWTVRDGGWDLGLFPRPPFDAARLLLPLDTHVHRIAGYLGLTRRPVADLAAAREATAWLARIDAPDPVSFDWALSRLGILAECVRDREQCRCDRCPVRPACRVARRLPAQPPAPRLLESA